MNTSPEKVDWTVSGMTCSNCALTISKYLQQQGMKDILVNPLTGSVSFINAAIDKKQLIKGIETLGYHVNEISDNFNTVKKQQGFLNHNKGRFLVTLPFTLLLMLHMVQQWIELHWLMNPYVQLLLCLPVFIIGMLFFGRSAWKSLLNGMPNMNVLVALGSLAAFVYSVTGTILQLGVQYQFYETAASIITLVFLGNYLEETSIQKTQREIKKLITSQKVMANMIAFDDQHQEQIFPIENTQLKTGDLILIKSGEKVPIDCKILWGSGMINESIITGESNPVYREKKQSLIGGSIVEDGIFKAQVTATGADTVLSSIVKMVQMAQSEKPPLQKMADKISAVFVPVVVGISLITFFATFMVAKMPVGTALMNAIAVLVISCPCAMGLATPAGIAVGLGRAAKNGILFKSASALEHFKSIQQIVFDKTGTLTTGHFKIAGYKSKIDEDEFKKIVYSIEKYSNHPIAVTIAKEWKQSDCIAWAKIEEKKGLGITATDKEGNCYEAGSYRLLQEIPEEKHNIYLLKNKTLLGWIDVQDEIRPEAKKIITQLKQQHIKIILLSGDSKEKCTAVGNELGITDIIAEQTPEEKMKTIASLNAIAPTAMVGDGINDAPALAQSTLGISISNASQIAMQSAAVILIDNGLHKLPIALGIGKHTHLTIRQNLFWAFIYNIIAIPIAAFGWLTPTVAALSMAGSDVILAANSIRLFVKKVV